MLIAALHQSATKGYHFLTEEENNYQIPLPAKTLTVQDTHPVLYERDTRKVPENAITYCWEKARHGERDERWSMQRHLENIKTIIQSRNEK